MEKRPSQPVLPERIDRYGIQRLLGKGGQGVVLLAHDDELERPVAIKLLRHDPEREQGVLVSEARIVSRLQHPNIVTLYDVGMYGRLQYLVFEFIEGESLQSRIREVGKLDLASSVILMSQILAGVAYLHENNVVHRDLSPANILLTRDGMPKVTDFGISVLHQSAQVEEGSYAGTLRYMSPEPFIHKAPGPASDVFTLATIFYEMLTGKHLYDAPSLGAIVSQIVDGKPLNMAALGHEVPEIIGKVLRKATQRSLARRYTTAREMKNELDEFRLPRANNPDDESRSHSTVDFLMRRMAIKRGFSSLSAHVSELLEITAETSMAPATRLVNIIAKDITLTQRVLTMANSAYYGNAQITALPRAVVLLGLDQMRMCITSALLDSEFESGSVALREALARSFHSAILAKSLAGIFGVRNRADAFTAALFHDLGRVLTIHYFADEYAAILERTERLHSDDLTESRNVLGVVFHDLGAAVARHWNFADSTIKAMKPLPRGVIEEPGDDETLRLRLCAGFVNSVSSAISFEADPENRDTALAALTRRLTPTFTLETKTLEFAIAEAAQLTEQYTRLVRVGPDSSPATARLLSFRALAGAA